MPAQDRNTVREILGLFQKDFPVAPGTTIFENMRVGLNGSDKLVEMTDTAGVVFVGYADGKVENLATATEDILCACWIAGFAHVNNTGTALTFGEKAMAKFGGEVQAAIDATQDIVVGIVRGPVDDQADLLTEFGGLLAHLA